MNGVNLFLLGWALGMVSAYASLYLLVSIARRRAREQHLAKLRRNGWPV